MTCKKLACLLLAFLPAVAWGGAAELIDPLYINLDGSVAAVQVGAAVKTSFLNHGFTVDNERPGYLEGKFAKNRFWARVAVSYNDQRVTFQYLASSGLNYSDNGKRRVIHPNYNKWVDTVARDASASLKSAAAPNRR